MTGSAALQVVVCAGGLGTRIAGWSRYVPQEFYPVAGMGLSADDVIISIGGHAVTAGASVRSVMDTYHPVIPATT